MSHIGFVCFPGLGHLIPSIALGRRLRERGHRVTFFHSAFARPRLISSGLDLWPLDNSNWISPDETAAYRHIGTKAQLLQRLKLFTQFILQEGASAVSAAKIDALVVDQAALAGGSIAERVGIPFATVCFFPPVILDGSVPQPIFAWQYGTGALARIRNFAADLLIEASLKPILSELNDRRSSWNLPSLGTLNEISSRLAVISQMPHFFDFPHNRSYPHLYYTGPFRDLPIRRPPFPWDRLDGRRLIYASLGTVRNDIPHMFRIIAEACASNDTQLVLSLGGGRLNPEDLGQLPGDPIVVHFAPQIEILRRATLTITHAGMNTTLESLAEGVPIVAIPIADDQPGVAARIKWTGVGTVLSANQLSVRALRAIVSETLSGNTYRTAAQSMKRRIASLDGATVAADILETTLCLTRDPDLEASPADSHQE